MVAIKKSLRDIVVIEPHQVADSTADGVLLAEESRDLVISGKIVKIGTEVKELAVGDEILFKRGLTDGFSFEGKQYLFTTEKNVIAVI